MSGPHWAPTSSEEEDLALAMAISASLAQEGGRPSSNIPSRPGAYSALSNSNSYNPTSPHQPTAPPSANSHLTRTHSGVSGYDPRYPPIPTFPYPQHSAPPASQPPNAGCSNHGASSSSSSSSSRPWLHPPAHATPSPAQPTPPRTNTSQTHSQPSSHAPHIKIGSQPSPHSSHYPHWTDPGHGPSHSPVGAQQPSIFPYPATSQPMPTKAASSNPYSSRAVPSSKTAPPPPAPAKISQSPAKPQHQHQHMAAKPGAANAGKLFTDPNGCAGCGQRIGGLFTTSYITAMGRKWHSACFKCAFCSEPISVGGKSEFVTPADEGLPYHPDCYKHAHHPVCHVCGVYIPSRADGRIEFRENAFWKQRYCMSHLEAQMHQCCSCSRYQKHGTPEYAQLTDGREVCLECINTIVVDTQDAQPLYNEVLQFYRDMRMPHVERPPLMLVDAFTLNEYGDREGRDRGAGGPVFHVRGLTVATVYRSIPSIVRSLSGFSGSRVNVDSVSTPLQSGVRCTVTAVLILYGLPRLLTGCIMAHELMHAYLRMRHVTGLSPKVEEGLCQLMACLWLDQQHDSLAADPVQQRLSSYFAYQIRNDTSEVYGDGFREAYEAFQLQGLTGLVENVLRTGCFT